VWKFLRQNKLAYCSLYDEGYTSLGEKHNSQKNPYLRKGGAEAESEIEKEEEFMAAY
jgi:3'-phosphoadenosine 5'-phosphosulfate sulfotransferase (PAPS reductase)/FAD synthetase